ncbi:hypothetical protein PPERSA_04988 [Pseudocohnilembus persalinus]|uniref:Uncharacterized protein n=1 Tax=Pseudocohnilembus persalinus TaxID=266149 RepID=A0A0V0QVV8_PSEPJ|nr:hypothetical protein PPERSA_04988 [Pseudocohnilembus persalinus]|eukprot:KRX06375.1 hypothetical protein PPERSA_04988 [Pseudocohnilembus persalinus]
MDSSKDLKHTFKIMTQGKNEIDGKTFAKMAKDCEILDKNLTLTQVDLIFAKVKGNPHIRTLNYETFQKGLEMMAEKKETDFDSLVSQIIEHGGVHYQGTKGYSKFHDDKSTYTGQYKHEKPIAQDEDKIEALHETVEQEGQQQK